MNKKEFVEVDRKMCEEVNNCFGVKVVDGKKYCRGCGNIQPEGIPIGYADQSDLPVPAAEHYMHRFTEVR